MGNFWRAPKDCEALGRGDACAGWRGDTGEPGIWPGPVVYKPRCRTGNFDVMAF